MAFLLEQFARRATFLLPRGYYFKRVWIGALLCAGILWLVTTVIFATNGPPTLPHDPLSTGAVRILEEGFHVKLKNQANEEVTEQQFYGHPTAVFFGFTFCPQVCPTTLASLSAMMKDLGPQSDKIKVVFVTIDPERDTTSLLSAYLGSFDARFIGLTGSTTEIDKLAHAFGAYVKRIPLDGGGFTYDHTATVYLLNSKAELSGTISFDESRDIAITKLKRLATLAP